MAKMKSKPSRSARGMRSPPTTSPQILTTTASRSTLSSNLSLALTALLLAAGAAGVILLARRPSTAYPYLPPDVMAVVLPLLNQVRTSSMLSMPPVPASPVWHRARHLMATSFAPVQAIEPRTRISHVWQQPLVTFFDDYLSEEDVSLLIAKAEPYFEKSKVVRPDGSVAEDPSRTSETAWIYPRANATVDAVVQKLAALAGFSWHNAEAIAVNRYRKAQFFAPHHDFLDEDHLRNTKGDFKHCQRTATVLVYLSDVDSGGETMFVRKGHMGKDFEYEANNPDHLSVKPSRGRVLVWFDMHPHTEDVDHRTLHGGAPVKEGVKMAATLFLRNCTSDAFKTDTAEKQDL